MSFPCAKTPGPAAAAAAAAAVAGAVRSVRLGEMDRREFVLYEPAQRGTQYSATWAKRPPQAPRSSEIERKHVFDPRTRQRWADVRAQPMLRASLSQRAMKPAAPSFFLLVWLVFLG